MARILNDYFRHLISLVAEHTAESYQLYNQSYSQPTDFSQRTPKLIPPLVLYCKQGLHFLGGGRGIRWLLEI